MRRIMHSTTAIAACLSILAPHVVTAQTVLPEDEPAAQTATQTDPAMSDAPTPQADNAVTDAVDSLATALGEQQEEPAAEAEAPEEPAAEETTTEEPVAEEKVAEEPAPEKARTAEKPAKDKTRAKAKDDIPADPAPAQANDDAPEPAADPKAAKADTEQQTTEPAQDTAVRDADRAQRREAGARKEKDAVAAADKVESDAKDEQGTADALAAALAAEEAQSEDVRRAQAASKADESNPAEAMGDSEKDASAKDAAAKEDAKGIVVLAGSKAARDRNEAMKNLAGVLASEVEGGLTEAQLSCLSGGSAPCAAGDPLVTPGGVVVERNSNNRYMLAGARVQMYRADGKGNLSPRAAEEGTEETEGAREAASETQAPAAAALDAGDAKGAVTEETVTKANSRASSEDFQTSLRDALTNTGKSKADKKDDDDNTLRNALLLGLGAVAVGSVLNNNRQVALSSPDRLVVQRPDGSQEVIRDDTVLLRQPGSTVATENFDDGSSRTIVTREDGSKVVTIRDVDLRVLRRTLVSADGTQTSLIDDTADVQPVNVSELPAPAPVNTNAAASQDEAALRAALQTEARIGRSFTLGQIRNIPEVRALVAPVNINAITFDTGSAAIKPDQARRLSGLGKVIQDAVRDNPREIFLIEGYTDTVGSDAANLALSDRRAESVALALTEYFDVPPENLVSQGYGEQFLMIRAEGDIRDNRRASVRRITDLLRTADAR